MTTTLSFRSLQAYLTGALLVVGNILLPQLAHQVPQGGLILLPIYFFTLISAYRYGLAAGLTTAVLSPLINHIFFGMPPLAVLPILLIKSVLLACAAAWMANKAQRVSVLHILGAVVLYQGLGMLAEWAMTGSWAMAVQDVRLGYPGLLLQIFGGFAVLKLWAKRD